VPRRRSSSLLVALAFAALATIMRPSNAVIWLFLGGHLFFSSSGTRRLAMLRSAFLIGCVLFSSPPRPKKRTR